MSLRDFLSSINIGTAYNMPHYYQCSRSLLNPDEYKTIFGRKFEDSIKIWAYSGAITVPKLPSFLALPPVNASWEGLQSILPTALAYGVIGYPLLIAGAIGGDYYVPGNDSTILSYHSLDQPQLPDQVNFLSVNFRFLFGIKRMLIDFEFNCRSYLFAGIN